MGSMVGLVRGSSNMVSEPGGLEFKPWSRVIISDYRSPYGDAYVAQTSGPLNGAAGPWLAHNRKNIRI
jgi:hypothetical protein